MFRFMLAAAIAAGLAAPSAQAQQDPSQPQPPQPSSSNPLARLALIPDISAIGSASIAFDSYDVAARSPREGRFGPPHTFEPAFDELELGLQAVVDPYARADIFVSFSDEGAEVEEGYVTFLTLPLGLQARAGKLFSPFGRMNPQHPHTWEFADRPLALQRLLGGHALGGPGVEASWLAPTPWFAEVRVAYQGVSPVLHGAEEEAGEEPPAGEEAHAEEDAQRRAGVVRLLQYLDVSPGATLGVGLSGATMAEPEEGWRDLAGADLYVKLGAGSAKEYVALQGELVWSRLRGTEADRERWGAYAQAVHRFSRALGYGARYERAPGLDGGTEHRVGLVGQWMPSEFQRVLAQTSWVRLPDGGDGLEAILALEFSIGAHGAHAF